MEFDAVDEATKVRSIARDNDPIFIVAMLQDIVVELVKSPNEGRVGCIISSLPQPARQLGGKALVNEKLH